MYVIRRKGVRLYGKVAENCGAVRCVNEEESFGILGGDRADHGEG
jgi:hypothetical protein